LLESHAVQALSVQTRSFGTAAISLGSSFVVAGTVDGCVLVWGFGGGLDASPRRFSPEPFLVLPFAIHGITSVCVRDDWNCFVAAWPSALSTATAAPSSVVSLFSLPTGVCRWSYEVQMIIDVVFITSRGDILCVSAAPAQLLLLSANGSVVRTHLFPDDATGAVVITAAATAAAADVLAVGTVTGVVYLFDSESLVCLHVLRDFEEAATGIAISRDASDIRVFSSIGNSYSLVVKESSTSAVHTAPEADLIDFKDI